MIRVVLATTNILASLVFGALAMGFVWYLSPDTIQTLFQTASSFKGWVVSRGLSSSYNNFLWFLIEEKQLVFMGFVMATRIVLAILVSIIMKMLGHE